jgi:hypothetical protein
MRQFQHLISAPVHISIIIYGHYTNLVGSKVLHLIRACGAFATNRSAAQLLRRGGYVFRKKRTGKYRGGGAHLWRDANGLVIIADDGRDLMVETAEEAHTAVFLATARTI